jgi:hypothetical protein
MIVIRQRSSTRFHAIKHDFKTEIGNAFVTTPVASFCADAPSGLGARRGERRYN